MGYHGSQKAIIITSEYNHRGMQKSIIISLFIFCIAAILVAGCTTSQGSAGTSTTTATTSISSTTGVKPEVTSSHELSRSLVELQILLLL